MALLTAALPRAFVLWLIWWVLSEADLSGLAFGGGAAVFVALLSVRLYPLTPYRLRPVGVLVFAGYFLFRSVIAGIDVAGRLINPRLPVNPGSLELQLNLPEGSPRWLLANTLSLMPGTLSMELVGDRLTLHCLDVTQPVEPAVRHAERRIARLFGLPEPGREALL